MDITEISRKYQIHIVAAMILILIGFFICNDACKHNREIILTIEYNGFITRKFIDTQRRYTPAINVDGEIYSVYNPEAYEAMSEGDYAFKRKNNLAYYYVKGKDTVQYFAECGGKLLDK